MKHYIVYYIVPVLVLICAALVYMLVFERKSKLRIAALIVFGFLLGWISAYSSLYFFHLYR